MGTAMSAGIQMLEALEDLHSAGYLHRDVKPHNYTVEKGEGHRIYLVDFGISRAYANEGVSFLAF
jgi:serine/threonine protein kinase